MSEQTFTIQSKTEELGPLREQVRKLLNDLDAFETKDRDSILVALGEACTNSIRHSYHQDPNQKVELTIQDEPEKMTFRIRDWGEKIKLGEVKKPELPPTKGGGLGLYFMETIMDEMQYNTDHKQGNELILTKYKTQRSAK